jgi:hemin uptake protein HemP
MFGAIASFGRTSQGYVAVFEDLALRVVRFNTKAEVQQDVQVPNLQASTFNPNGWVAMDQQGNVYLLGLTDAGMVVSRAALPDAAKTLAAGIDVSRWNVA